MKVVRFLTKCLLVIITFLSTVLLGLYIYAQFSGPIGPIPGGKLNGEFTSSKPDWKALLPDGKFIEVQFNSKNPYSVTLAPHVIDDELYTCRRTKQSSQHGTFDKRTHNRGPRLITDWRDLRLGGHSID